MSGRGKRGKQRGENNNGQGNGRGKPVNQFKNGIQFIELFKGSSN